MKPNNTIDNAATTVEKIPFPECRLFVNLYPLFLANILSPYLIADPEYQISQHTAYGVKQKIIHIKAAHLENQLGHFDKQAHLESQQGNPQELPAAPVNDR